MSTSEAVASIDWLYSIPDEILDASGKYGRAYRLQQDLEHAQNRLRDLRSDLYHEIDQEQRRAHAHGHIGGLTPSWEQVENHPAVIDLRERVEALAAQVEEAQTEIGGIVFLPATDNLPKIEKKLAALTRRAAKIGSEPITLEITDEKLVLHYKTSEEDMRGGDFEHVFAVLKGATPRIPGFEFLATITPTEHGNVVKRIPAIAYGVRHGLDFGNTDREYTPAKQALDAIDLTRFHSTGDVCEHCHKERRRSDLYVVYNEETGETKQVGRTCLRDFTGVNDPERVLKTLEMVWEFMRSVRESRGEQALTPTSEFLTHCHAMFRTGSRKGTGRDAASNIFNLTHDVRDTRTGQPLYVTPIAVDERAAEHILRWVAEWQETSEFATNVKLALAGSHMDPKLYGIGGAAFIARENWLARSEQRAQQEVRQARQATKTHIGTVGERETFQLTVKAVKWIADRYSYNGEDKPLYIFEDDKGNEVKWFGSSVPTVPDNERGVPVDGGTYRIKATVKKHEDSEQYGKSTVITRAKFEATISEPES